jgi:hypothetical protein
METMRPLKERIFGKNDGFERGGLVKNDLCVGRDRTSGADEKKKDSLVT